MGGLQATVTFTNGDVQGCIWAPTAGLAGGCSAAGFNIGQEGDTFDNSNPWTLTNMTTFATISVLELDGSPLRGSDSGVVFDRTFDGFVGTLGSALGKDANGTTTDASDASAVYRNLVAVQPNARVGDIFHTLIIRFSGNGLGAGQSGVFAADSDTIGTFVPEPGSIALVGLGLLILARKGYARRS